MRGDYWMVVYSDDGVEIASALRSRPALDPVATEELLRTIWPTRSLDLLEHTASLGNAAPADDSVYAAVWPGVSVICTYEAAINRPSEGLGVHLRDAGAGRIMHTFAMTAMNEWCAFSRRDAERKVVRALSIRPDYGVIENSGEQLAFEQPFWAGEHGTPDPLPFPPLAFGQAALQELFGIGTIDPSAVELAWFAIGPYIWPDADEKPKRRLFRRRG